MKCSVCRGDIDQQYSDENFYPSIGKYDWPKTLGAINAKMLLQALSKVCIGCVCLSGFDPKNGDEYNGRKLSRVLIDVLRRETSKRLHPSRSIVLTQYRPSSLQRLCLMDLCAAIIGNCHEFNKTNARNYHGFLDEVNKHGFNIWYTPNAVARKLRRKHKLKGLACLGHRLDYDSYVKRTMEVHELLVLGKHTPSYMWQAVLVKRDWSRMPLSERLYWYKHFNPSRSKIERRKKHHVAI